MSVAKSCTCSDLPMNISLSSEKYISLRFLYPMNKFGPIHCRTLENPLDKPRPVTTAPTIRAVSLDP